MCPLFIFIRMSKKIIGLGNALADILTPIASDFVLEELGFGRGSMNLVDEAIHRRISEVIAGHSSTVVSGGAAANTMRGLARLGVQASYIGKISHDPIGRHMQEEMERLGVVPQLIESTTPTGRCMVLISPDGERTMATFLGAAVELTAPEIRREMFGGYDILHIEGYLVQNHELIASAMQKAKEAGLTISLDMASYNVVAENREFLDGLIRDYVDIIFANEDEAKTFTGLEPREAAIEMEKRTEITVVKTGEQGSLIAAGGMVTEIAAVPARVVDTTGAGDLYATGFLYGLSKGLPLGVCGGIGSLVASHSIGVIGPTLSEGSVEEIKRTLSEREF